jgi:hypothetical protein
VDTVEECGLKQNRITVTYLFCQPDQAMPLALPQSYSTGRVIWIPVTPQTVGHHIRKKRLGLKMLQKDVAEQLARDHWVLGHDPLPKANTLGEQLVR